MASGIGGFFFGKTPKVPDLKPVSASSVQRQTVADNIGILPDAQELAGGFNQFTMEQLAKAREFWQPGQLAQVNRNISQELSGELAPEDTRALISSATAAGYGRGFGSSFGTMGIGRNLVLRDLGLAVQQQKQRGFANFLSLARQTETPLFDYSAMFFTPQQRLTFEQNRAEQEFNRNWIAAQMEAAPHPAGAYTMQLLMEVAKAAAGSLGAAGCWVARECYGEDNPNWLLFRAWLYEDAPAWFRNAYLMFGKTIARLIRPIPKVKAIIRKWMDSKIALKYGD